uniref:BUD13 homolog n=1 Tax=Caenorhabditis tropicalis TaxID=1561998 RepID=A0A1I7U9S3_9PELO
MSFWSQKSRKTTVIHQKTDDTGDSKARKPRKPPKKPKIWDFQRSNPRKPGSQTEKTTVIQDSTNQKLLKPIQNTQKTIKPKIPGSETPNPKIPLVKNYRNLPEKTPKNPGFRGKPPRKNPFS